MNTSKLFSAIVLILLLSVAKVPAQVPEEVSQAFQKYGYEYDGIKPFVIEDLHAVAVNFDDEEGNRIVVGISSKPLLDFSEADFQSLNIIMNGNVLHFETFNIKGQDRKLAAMVLKNEERIGTVSWSIGYFIFNTGETTVYMKISGEGRKAKVMKEFREILAQVKENKFGEGGSK